MNLQKYFKLKNIKNEPKTTLIGLSILVSCFVMPMLSDVTFKDMMPPLAIVIPFLLYGNNNNKGNDSNGKPPIINNTGPLVSVLLVFAFVACDPFVDGIAPPKKIEMLQKKVDQLDSLYTLLDQKYIKLHYTHQLQKKNYEKYIIDTLPSLEHLLRQSPNIELVQKATN